MTRQTGGADQTASAASSSLELKELANQTRQLLSRHLQVRRFRKGALLWREGETSGMLVAIKAGRVKIYRLLPNGRAVTMYLFGPDDVFGFLPFLDGQAYPAYAQAVEDVEAEVMSRTTLLQVLRSEPELALTLIALLGRRLRTAFDLIQGMSTPGARARVASALLPLITETEDRGPLVVKLPVTAHDFAGAIGIAAETFSRALSSLSDEGILERAGHGRYRVLDRQALERAAEPPID